jgi:hypothetical protein
MEGIAMRNAWCFLLIILFVKYSFAGFGEYGKWHPEVNSRPRLLFLQSDKYTIQSRLSNGIFHDLYDNDYTNRHGSAKHGIFWKAKQIHGERGDNWKRCAQRAYIAKNAAFVYYMNLAENGTDPLSSGLREQLKDKVIKYLREIDTRVRTDWADYGDVQWRAKELLYYCQAYDLLMGDTDSEILSYKEEMEEKIHTLAANLFYVIDIHKELPSWYPETATSKNNKRVIAATALGIAALTLGHRGSDISNRTSDANNRKWRPDSWIGAAMSTIYYLLRTDSEKSMVTSDGSYREGPHYFRYISNVYLPFVRAMKNFESLLRDIDPSLPNPWLEYYYNFGEDWNKSYNLENPYTKQMFQKIYDYYTIIRQPEGRIPAIKDSYTDAYFPELALVADIKAFYSWPYKSFEPGWNNDALLNSELIANGADSRIDYICAGNLPTNEGLPESWKRKFFTVAGSYVYRTSWDFDAFYFHLHGNNFYDHLFNIFGDYGHYQEDASSFIINLGGDVLALDPGYYKWQDADLVNKAKHHNVITVDGGGVGKTKKFKYKFGKDNSRYFYFKLKDQSSQIYRERYTFGLKDSEHPYIIIYDKCNFHEDVQKEWKFLLHGNGYINDPENTFEINYNDKTGLWKHNGKKLKSYSASIPEGTFTYDQSVNDDGYGRLIDHSVLQYEINNRTAKYLTLLDAFTSSAMDVQDISNSVSEYKSYLINRSDASPYYELVMMQENVGSIVIPAHTFGNIYQGEIYTDAEMLLISIPKELTDSNEIKLITQNATFVHYGKIYFYHNNSNEICSDFTIEDYHMKSHTARATGYNNGRRIAKGSGDALHLVYEDNGEIWYTNSYDNGKTWQIELLISGKSSEDAYYTNPSITCSYDYGGNVHIVWECVGQTTYGDIHDIEYRRKNYDGWTETTNISSPYLFIQEKVMRPVIHAISYGDLYIVWAGYSESENKYYTYIKILDGYGQWHDIEEVPGVNGYPLISCFNAGLHKTVIIWSQDGEIKYIDGKYTSSNWVWSSIKSLTSNFNSEIHNNCNPTMSIDAYYGISYIAWEANRISDDKKCLYYCKYDLTDAAGPSPIGDLTLIDSYDNQTFNPTISWDEYDDLLTLFYQKNSKIFRSRNDDTSSNWTTKDYSYGIYPSICCNYNIGAVWTKYDDAPYMIISDWGNITGSVTWSDKVVLESNVYVESGATLTIEPGTEIKLDDDIKITVEEGGKIIANGASLEKIKFLRSNEDQAWDKILLEGDNNEFSHCIFDGGYYNVDVRSLYNTFTNCTFKNGVRGINTYKRPQGDWSCFELSNCTFENNSNGGVVALYTYGAINSCTIKNNPGYGLYLYNARIGNNSSYGDKCGLFRENHIHDNGTYGVVLAYNGILWSGYGSHKGYNQIINNGSHEIYLQDYTNARFYDSNYGGYSSIYDQSGGRYIYNLSKTYDGEYYVAATVTAENNYWGSAAGPSSSNFYGPVDYTPYLSSDPTEIPGIDVAGDDSENGGEVLSEGIVNSICGSSAGSGVSNSGQGLVDLKNKIQELRNQIDNNPDDLSNARRLNEMYSLLTDYDPEDILKEKQLLLEKIAGYRQRLLDNPSGNESVQLIGETAMLLEINNLTEKKEYENAMAMLNDYDKYIKNSDNRRELLSNKLAIFEDKKEYEQALAVLIDLREEVKGDHDHYTPPTYEIIEQNLKSELGIDDDPHAKGNAPENDAFDIVQKLEFALYNNYPNPFNPVTTIPFSLAENSYVKIEVFDILGRKITVLADRVYEKGSYNVNFNGNALASGLYFIRTQMKSKENEKTYSFMKKMLLMK